MMKAEQLYLSTIAEDAAAAARRYGLGLEIAEFCTACNMDEHYAPTDAALRKKLHGIGRRILHAPFNELFPCAVDPKARELATYRFRQAMRLSGIYGVEKIVFHGGYHPKLYYPVWYVEQSVAFWRDFLKDAPDTQIVLENVLEEDPQLLPKIVEGVDDPRLRLCLDIGHVNACSAIPAEEWLRLCAPYLSHFHLHNNDGSWDTHSALDCGTLPIARLLRSADMLCPNATFTLEVTEAAPSVAWLLEHDILRI